MVRAADQTGGITPSIRPAAPPQSVQPEIAAAGPTLPSDTRTSIPETIVIQRGDSLSRVASRYHLSLAQLRSLNPQLFTSGTDETGKKRAADGGLIYPGEAIRLRPVESAPATTQKVVQAAKEQIDQATDSTAKKNVSSLLRLIPETDPEHGTYRKKVGDLLATLEGPTESASSFQEASDAFNAAVSAYQEGQKAGKPATDAAQAEAFTRALGAYSRATSAVQQLPAGTEKDTLSEQLRIMEFTLSQLTPPPAAGPSPQPGGSTPLPLGQLPGSAPAGRTPTGTVPPAVPPAAIPPQAPVMDESHAPEAEQDGLPGMERGRSHGIKRVQPRPITRVQPRPITRVQPPVMQENAPGTAAPSGTNPSAPGPVKKDPNDPKVQQIWKALEQADHKAIRDMASNTEVLAASLPEQKAVMAAKLLAGWTSGDDQLAIARIVDMAAKQGENETFVGEMDRMNGGEHKGVVRLLEDLNREVRGHVVCRLLDLPPDNLHVEYSHGFHAAVVAALDKADVETLCEKLGTNPQKGWLTRISADLRQLLADKLKSWWPFGGNSAAISALTGGLMTNP